MKSDLLGTLDGILLSLLCWTVKPLDLEDNNSLLGPKVEIEERSVKCRSEEFRKVTKNVGLSVEKSCQFFLDIDNIDRKL